MWTGTRGRVATRTSGRGNGSFRSFFSRFDFCLLSFVERSEGSLLESTQMDDVRMNPDKRTRSSSLFASSAETSSVIGFEVMST